MSISKEARRAKHQIFEQLVALRDQGKLQLHLLSLDAKKRWSELEEQADSLEARADQEGEKALGALKEAANELTRTLNDFMTRHLGHSEGLLTSARALMTEHVRCCGPGDSLTEAAQLMWNGDCGVVAVVADGRVVAVITDRDVCMATFTQGKAPSELQVGGAMSKRLVTCAPDASIASVLATMTAERVRRLPIVSDDAKLLGLISLADLARWAKLLADPAVDAAVIEALGSISGHAPHKMPAAAE
jgi:CBS domain-containing protein